MFVRESLTAKTFLDCAFALQVDLWSERWDDGDRLLKFSKQVAVMDNQSPDVRYVCLRLTTVHGVSKSTIRRFLMDNMRSLGMGWRDNYPRLLVLRVKVVALAQRGWPTAHVDYECSDRWPQGTDPVAHADGIF